MATGPAPVKPDPSELVSVIVPVYGAALLRAALDSIFRQTFRAIEVIVVNDGSPDTARFEAAIAPYRERVCVVTQPNLGAGAARNTGLAIARGEYVAFLDADDCWRSTFLSDQMSLLRQRDADVAYCDAIIVGHSPLAGRRYMDLAPSREPVTLDDLITQRSNVILSSVVAKKSAIDAVGRFDASLRRGQDFDLWVRMAANRCRFVFQRKALVERHERSQGSPDERIADLDRLLAVLLKTERTLSAVFGASTRAALAERIRWVESEREIEFAKRALGCGRIDHAAHHLRRTRERSVKVQIARAALILAPRLAARSYALWRGWLMGRRRRRQRVSSIPSESASI